MADDNNSGGPTPGELFPNMDQFNQQVPIAADNLKKMNANFANSIKGIDNLGKSFNNLGEKIVSAMGGNDRKNRNQNAGSAGAQGAQPF